MIDEARQGGPRSRELQEDVKLKINRRIRVFNGRNESQCGDWPIDGALIKRQATSERLARAFSSSSSLAICASIEAKASRSAEMPSQGAYRPARLDAQPRQTSSSPRGKAASRQTASRTSHLIAKRTLHPDKLVARSSVLILWLSADFTCTAVNQPVRSISAKAQASALSLLMRRLLIASGKTWRIEVSYAAPRTFAISPEAVFAPRR